jgi:hypothetical protein
MPLVEGDVDMVGAIEVGVTGISGATGAAEMAEIAGLIVRDGRMTEGATEAASIDDSA